MIRTRTCCPHALSSSSYFCMYLLSEKIIRLENDSNIAFIYNQLFCPRTIRKIRQVVKCYPYRQTLNCTLKDQVSLKYDSEFFPIRFTTHHKGSVFCQIICNYSKRDLNVQTVDYSSLLSCGTLCSV